MLGGCSEARLAVHVAKEVADQSSPEPRRGYYKVGTPYQINGVWYYPAEVESYDETGIASWYGPNFHGKSTANGEVFDQWALSAAHKTLPMPSQVRVTNLENGRALMLRINDRGPFVGNRIIDLSRRAAQLLGMEEQGVAKVRVQLISFGPDDMAPARPGQGPRIVAAPAQAVAGEALPPLAPAAPVTAAPIQSAPAPVVAAATPQPAAPAAEPRVTQQPVTPSPMFVQVGAFAEEDNAIGLAQTLSSLGRVVVTPVQVDGQRFYRVRLGPAADIAAADALLARAVAAGIPGAHIVIDRQP